MAGLAIFATAAQWNLVQKARAGESWRHTKVTLKPDNPAYAPTVLEGVEEDAVQVIAELVDVLGVAPPIIECTD